MKIGVVLTAFTKGNMQPRIRALSTRAYENMVAVAMANPNGDNAGCSCAYSPICWDRNGKCIDNTVLLADDVTEGIFMLSLIWSNQGISESGNARKYIS